LTLRAFALLPSLAFLAIKPQKVIQKSYKPLKQTFSLFAESYDWHAPEDGGEYPWGDEAKAKDAIEWAKTAFCQKEHADKLLYVLTDCGWNDKERRSLPSLP
jgi:hypothetical protein